MGRDTILLIVSGYAKADSARRLLGISESNETVRVEAALAALAGRGFDMIIVAADAARGISEDKWMAWLNDTAFTKLRPGGKLVQL